jgi:hypothetical protein
VIQVLQEMFHQGEVGCKDVSVLYKCWSLTQILHGHNKNRDVGLQFCALCKKIRGKPSFIASFKIDFFLLIKYTGVGCRVE